MGAGRKGLIGMRLEASRAQNALCREQIAGFKRPKAYHFVTALPKNNYGKVLKTDLREIDQRLEKGS